MDGWQKLYVENALAVGNFKCKKPNKVGVFLHEWNDVPVRVPLVVSVGFPGFPVPFQVAEDDKVPTYQCVRFGFCSNGCVGL